MAITINGTVEVKTPNLEPTVGAYKKLKTEIKQAKDELANLDAGTVAYAQKAAQIGNLTNEVDDLNKSISAVSGAPMENLTGSFGLLSNQVKNLDLDGATASFKSLWATIAANPIIAIASAVALLVENWEEINKVFNDFVGIQEVAIVNTTEIKNLSAERETQLEREIELLIASGAKTETIVAAQIKLIEVKKANILLDLIDAKAQQERADAAEKQTFTWTKFWNAVLGQNNQLTSFEDGLKSSAEATSEWDKQIALLTKTFGDLDQQIAVIQKREETRKRELAEDKAEEANKKAIANRKKRAEEEARIESEKNDVILNNEIASIERRIDNENAARIARKAEIQAERDEDAANQEAARAEQARLRAESAEYARKIRADDLLDEKKALAEKSKAAIEGQKLATAAVGSLSSILYNIKAKNLEKGSKAEQEAARKAFDLDKGVQLSMAVINGIQATIAAFASGSKFGPIVGAAYAAAAATVSAANILKIKNTTFTPTAPTATPDSTGDTGEGGLGAINVTPTAPSNAVSAFQPTTGLNPDGSVINTGGNQLTVSEGEITEVQQRVEVLESRARF